MHVWKCVICVFFKNVVNEIHQIIRSKQKKRLIQILITLLVEYHIYTRTGYTLAHIHKNTNTHKRLYTKHTQQNSAALNYLEKHKIPGDSYPESLCVSASLIVSYCEPDPTLSSSSWV